MWERERGGQAGREGKHLLRERRQDRELSGVNFFDVKMNVEEKLKTVYNRGLRGKAEHCREQE